MNSKSGDEELQEIEKHDVDELRFYGFAGICIIRFQQAYDYLGLIFQSLIEKGHIESNVIFDSIRPVSSRCSVISRLIDLNRPDLNDVWRELKTRIQKAEDTRNSIAHGSPVFGGSITTINVDWKSGETEVLDQTEPYFFLQKQGYDDWTTELLFEEAKSLETLLSELYALGRTLVGSNS